MELRSKKPQIVILDIRMPGMDGLLVLQQIKHLYSGIKVVILTSAQDEQIMAEAKRLGADDYMVKPCDLKDLHATISAIMDTQ